jgi:uncharacterized protein with GYD domain
MPTYVLLSTLTSKGRQTMHRNPDRLEVVNREVAAYGCRVLAQYATLGQYDFVTIIQAPDNETVARLSVDLGSRGTVTIQTLPAISTLVLRKKLKEDRRPGATRPTQRKPA